jgi:hypothetical protein
MPQRLAGIPMMVELPVADSRAVGNKPMGVAAAENTAVGDMVEQRTGNRTEPRY